MKKLLLLAAALVMSVGAWAQTVVTTPQVSNEAVVYEYTFECCSSAAHSTSRFIGLSNGNLHGQQSVGQKFQFENAEGGYYIFTTIDGAKKYFNFGSSATLDEEASTIWTFRTSYNDNKVAIAPSTWDQGRALNNNGGTNSLQNGPCTGSGNACSHWTMTEYKVFQNSTTLNEWASWESWDVAAKGTTAMTEATEGYCVILGWDQQNKKDMYLYDNGTQVKGKAWTESPEMVWFVKKNDNKYSFRNFKTGKYITITNQDGAALNMSDTEASYNFNFSNGVAAIDNGSHGLDVANRGDNPTAWQGTGVPTSGSRRLIIYPVEFVPAAVKVSVTYSYTYDGHEFTTETIRTNKDEAYPNPTLSFYGYTLSAKPEGNVTEDCTKVIALTWNDLIKESTVSDGKFGNFTQWYYLENGDNKGNGYVVYDNNESGKSTMTTTAGTEDTYKWCFVRKAGTPYFYLYNKAAGATTAIREELSTDSRYAPFHNQGYAVAKTEGTLDMPLEIVQNGAGLTFRLAGVDGKVVLGKHVGSNLSIWGNQANLQDNGSRFVLTEAELECGSYTLDISQFGYSTLYLPENSIIPEDVTVYYCRYEDGKLKALELDGNVLPDHVGVIVEGKEGSYTFEYTEQDYTGSADYDDFFTLLGNEEETLTSECSQLGDVYVLSSVEGNIGFYKFAGEKLAANRAYYPNIHDPGVQGFVLDFGGESTTGIESLIQKSENGISFDLQGRRVNANVKGISIVNNKKVIR